MEKQYNKCMSLNPKLLEVLADPEDRGPLIYFETEQYLYNPRSQRRYAVRDGVPCMLVADSEKLEDTEHQKMMQRAKERGLKPNFIA